MSTVQQAETTWVVRESCRNGEISYRYFDDDRDADADAIDVNSVDPLDLWSGCFIWPTPDECLWALREAGSDIHPNEGHQSLDEFLLYCRKGIQDFGGWEVELFLEYAESYGREGDFIEFANTDVQASAESVAEDVLTTIWQEYLEKRARESELD